MSKSLSSLVIPKLHINSQLSRASDILHGRRAAKFR